ncbi:hypothetical protein GEMRC1_005970 [Eukaryota sp. GEM-RC1]
MTNTTVLELSIVLDATDTLVIVSLSDVFRYNKTLKKILLSKHCGHLNADESLVLVNALLKSSVIETACFIGFLFPDTDIDSDLWTNCSLRKLTFKEQRYSTQFLVQIIKYCSGLRKLVLHESSYLPTLFKFLEFNTCLLELQVVRKSNLTDEEAISLGKMLQKNSTLLVLNLNLHVTSFRFLTIVKGLNMNSTLLEPKLHFIPSDLSCLMLMFEVVHAEFKFYFDVSPHLIDVQNGVFCYAPYTYNVKPLFPEELSSLNCFLECYNIKELTLKRCTFTEEFITALCDLIRVNQSLTSFDFSRCVLRHYRHWNSGIDNLKSHELYSNLINAIQYNSRLKKISLTEIITTIKTYLFIIELISTGKLTSNIDIFPHSFDLSLGTISYEEVEWCTCGGAWGDNEILLLLDFLKSNDSIKRCTAFRSSKNRKQVELHTDNDRFCLSGGNLSTADVVSFIQSYLNSFNIKHLVFKDCIFSKESITALCDLIRENQSLTSFDFSHCEFPSGTRELCSNLIDALQFNSRLKKVTFKADSIRLTDLLYIFELVSSGQLTSNIDISPHLIDVQNGVFCYSAKSYSSYSFSSELLRPEDISSLQSFLKCFTIKELTLNYCEFTEESITALCDLISDNNSLNSFDFSGCKLIARTSHNFRQNIDELKSYEIYSNLIDAIQFNSRLKKVTFAENNFGLRTLLYIYELVSTGKLTSNIDISPHSFDLSLGTISYEKVDSCSGGVGGKEILLRFDFLKSNESFNLYTALPYNNHRNCRTPVDLHTDNDRFCLTGIGPFTTDAVAALQCSLKCFSIKELTFRCCEFTNESIVPLCDLIRVNQSLTSFDFSDCRLVQLSSYNSYEIMDHLKSDEIYSNLIDAIQSISHLKKVSFTQNNFGLNILMYIFELVSIGRLTSNIDVTPHLIDVQNGVFIYSPVFSKNPVSPKELFFFAEFF